MPLSSEKPKDLFDNMRVVYKSTLLEGYVDLIKDYRSSLEWRLSGGNHITPESQVFNVNYNHKKTRDYNTSVDPEKTIELEQKSQKFVLNNLEKEFKADKELIDFFTGLAKNISYCDPNRTKNQLESYYREIVRKTDINNVPYILTNQKRESLDKIFIKQCRWENPPEIGMFGIYKVRIDELDSDFKIVVKITDSYKDGVGNKMYKYDIVDYDDIISEHTKHWILNSDEPITPMCEKTFNFVENYPDF